ncbi:hypothetical protein SASPL_129669 [Salvia splendens]|uniref:Phospholipase/carboxylesterase/thioesterase domain-containing protein n=1 Tax=Salvia splendens TaxID=180675 RepID=A0A8X8XHL2_SALSN|nr:hypothetical protein SASPL_129669 [Salvia splendens]
MSFTAPSAAPSAAGRTFDFGRTYVVRPKGKHQATIVWLHGLGDNGNSWSTLLETLPLPNIKWICPTAPQRPVTLFGGFPSTAWFDVNDLSENANDDVHGLEASATYVASLLANEPADSELSTLVDMMILLLIRALKLGVGGFSMGAATSLYCATCFARGKFENGNQFSQNISAVVGLSGWLPCAKTLSSKLEGVAEASGRAASLPILLCHGKGVCVCVYARAYIRFLYTPVNLRDDVVAYKFGEKSAEKVTSTGFRDVTFKSYATLGHYTIPEEMDEVCAWLSSKMGLDGK